jgi:thioredoxin 1
MDTGKTPVLELNEQDLDNAIQSHANLVVDCWAPWCPDCRNLAPVFDALAQDNEGKVTLVKINMDNNRGVNDKYQILAVPTLLIFKDGKLVNRLVEPAPKKEALQAAISKSLA